ncbi:hypothetical protein Tco_0222136, partial [Tanacetum coccineum]
MSSNSNDIQAAGSDTRPPMLDRSDYESWSQRIRLYCRGKENGLQILQSIDQGPFELGTTRDALGTTPEGGSELTKEDIESQLYDEFERFKMLLVQDGRIVVQNVQGRQNVQGCKERSPPYTFDADVDNQLVQDLALNEDNIFQADECDAFDSDVDDEPTAQSIFMANLSLAGPANQMLLRCKLKRSLYLWPICPQPACQSQAVQSNASLTEVHMENAIDHSVTNQDRHEIHNEVQQANVIDLTTVDMGNSNVIPYEQYLSVNNVSVVPSCASSALNNACVLFNNDAYIPHDPIATELKIYEEQVAIYEQRAKFERNECEQRMDEQMRTLIQNRNKTE